jgi:hypothetical protein
VIVFFIILEALFRFVCLSSLGRTEIGKKRADGQR